MRESWYKEQSQTTECTETGSSTNTKNPQSCPVQKQTLSETNRCNICSSGGGNEHEGHHNQYSIHSSTNDVSDVMVSNMSHSSIVKHVCEKKREARPPQAHIDSSSSVSSDSVFQYIELSPSALSSDSKANSPVISELVTRGQLTGAQASPKVAEEEHNDSVSKESGYSLSPGMVEAVACCSILLDDSESGAGATGETLSKYVV